MIHSQSIYMGLYQFIFGTEKHQTAVVMQQTTNACLVGTTCQGRLWWGPVALCFVQQSVHDNNKQIASQ